MECREEFLFYLTMTNLIARNESKITSMFQEDCVGGLLGIQRNTVVGENSACLWIYFEFFSSESKNRSEGCFARHFDYFIRQLRIRSESDFELYFSSSCSWSG